MQTENALRVIDSAPLNRTHYILVFWCSFIMLFDGYDLVIYGSVLPHLMTEWSLSAAQAGMLGSSSMLGMMCGALVLGSLADRLGRRPIILGCVALFSTAAFANAFATDAMLFAVCRFATGVGLGGVVPNLVTILKETAPASCRNRLINLMLSFFAVGGLLSGFVGMYLVPQLGWHSAFYIAGFSLLALPLMAKTLPESVSYLVKCDRQNDVRELLARLNQTARIEPSVNYVLDAPVSGTALAALFQGGQGDQHLDALGDLWHVHADGLWP